MHLPILRAGRPYRSLNTVQLRHIANGEAVATVSQANAGLIARDFLGAAARRRMLGEYDVATLLGFCREAARHFVESELPVDPLDGAMQTPEQYVRTLSSTTGMPQAMARGNMEKIRFVLDRMETVLGGLTRGLDLEVLDAGWSMQGDRVISYRAEAETLGVILPSNSPGVHSLWLPAIPLKTPLVLKPGSQEPWTPMRVIQAFIAAGCPGEAFCFYPTDHGGAGEILLRSSRAMLFGDESTVRPWAHDTRIQLHGPGWSKVILGEDAVDGWREQLETMVASIADNGGRSCLNASGVWVPRRGREIAEALAEKLAAIEPRPLDDPAARVAAFSNPKVAHAISASIDRQLRQSGAEDLMQRHYPDGRVVEVAGCTFLRPTIVWCEDPGHPLASAEFLFPFAAVVELPQEQLLARIGSTLVATAVTDDPELRRGLMNCAAIDRLNLGSIPTSRVSWDQPHEGNMFDHLYRQRAFQAVGA